MNVDAAEDLAREVEPFIQFALSAFRPFFVIFFLFATPLFLAWWGSADDAERIAAAGVGPGVVAILGLCALAEHFLTTEDYTEEIEEFMTEQTGVAFDLSKAIAMGFILWYHFVVTDGTQFSASLGYTVAAGSPMGPVMMGAFGVGGAFHVAVSWARRQLMTVARDLGFGGLVGWIESLSVGGVLLLVVLAPLVALALCVMLVVSVLGVLGAVRAVERSIDKARRRACPTCGHMTRMEASLCPNCGATLEVVRPLSVRGASSVAG